jgi:hypothetical protein
MYDTVKQQRAMIAGNPTPSAMSYEKLSEWEASADSLTAAVEQLKRSVHAASAFANNNTRTAATHLRDVVRQRHADISAAKTQEEAGGVNMGTISGQIRAATAALADVDAVCDEVLESTVAEYVKCRQPVIRFD